MDSKEMNLEEKIIMQGLMVASFCHILSDYVDKQDFDKETKELLMKVGAHAFMDWVVLFHDKEALTTFAKEHAEMVKVSAMLMSLGNLLGLVEKD